MAESQVIGSQRGRRLSPAAPIRIATLLGLWLLWEAVSASGLLYQGVVPSSFRIMAALASLLTSPVFYDNLAFSLMEIVVALVIGGIAGAAIGLALGANRFAGAAYERYLHYLAPTPKIVFLPILLVLFGIGPGSKIAMGTLSCFFPIALSVAAGVRTVDHVLLKVGRSYNLTRSQLIRMIYLPSLVPPIANGLRLGLGVAIIGTLLAELKMSNRGIGFLIMQYYSQFRTPEMYAVLIVMFAIAAGANALVGRYVRLPGPR
ncbi:MAG: taurine transporter [Rhodospirillales bacterium]|jgi:NitT/TauT family transport system permease protein|nr:taurine transporter [Rhodospirillales bacterium]